MNRTQGELTNLTLKVLLDSGGAYKPQTHIVNVLIRLTTIEHFFILMFVIIKKGEIVGTKYV